MKRDTWIGILITIILILGLEFGLRYYEASQPPSAYSTLHERVVEDAILGYRPRPYYTEGQTHINSLSFRGEEFTVEKPTGVTRVVALGESTTIGISWYPSFSELMQRQVGSCPVQFINAGVEGYLTEQVRLRLIHDVRPLDPDVLLVYTGWNTMFSTSPDPDNPVVAADYNSPISRLTEYVYIVKYGLKLIYGTRPSTATDEEIALYQAYEAEHFRQELNELLDAAGNTPVVLFTLPSVLQAENTDPYNDIMNYPNFTGSPELTAILWRKYNAVIREVAAERDLLLFDLDAIFQATPGSSEYFFDTLHFDERGIELTAAHLLVFLRENDLMPCE